MYPMSMESFESFVCSTDLCFLDDFFFGGSFLATLSGDGDWSFVALFICSWLALVDGMVICVCGLSGMGETLVLSDLFE